MLVIGASFSLQILGLFRTLGMLSHYFVALKLNFFICRSQEDMGRPYLIRSDFPIPDNIPIFYFEVRVDNEGKDGYAIKLLPCFYRY